MLYVLYFIHVLVSLFLVLVVLLQQGKGADLSVFGGGATQAAFGARGGVNVLHRLTVVCFVVFILTTLSIGLLQSHDSPSVMRGVEAEGSAATTPEPAPAAPAGDQVEPPADGDDAEPPADDSEGSGEGSTEAEPPPAEPAEPPADGTEG